MTPKEALKKSKSLIAKENNWLQGVRFGSGRNGKEYGYCALGAMDKVLGYAGSEAKREAFKILAKCANITPDSPVDPYNGKYSDKHEYQNIIAHYNNISDHKTVMKWFDKAIKLAPT